MFLCVGGVGGAGNSQRASLGMFISPFSWREVSLPQASPLLGPLTGTRVHSFWWITKHFHFRLCSSETGWTLAYPSALQLHASTVQQIAAIRKESDTVCLGVSR